MDSERQWQCNTCAHQDMAKADHCRFYLPDVCLYPAHLKIIDVLEAYEYHFMSVYKWPENSLKYWEGELKKLNYCESG